MVRNKYSYALITAVKNEEIYIENTIKSVLSQEILPKKWVIVDDNSVDMTRDIVAKYALKYDYIKIIDSKNINLKRDFSSKSYALNIAYDEISNIKTDLVGVLDGDITFDSKYYKEIIFAFEENELLGLAGGMRYDWDGKSFRKVRASMDSVGGPVQMFRRKVIEKIMPFLPLKYGGEDAVAETLVKMHGFQVRQFPELHVYHHRQTGRQGCSAVCASFKEGMRYRNICYPFIPYVIRSVYRMRDCPFLISVVLRVLGYCFALMRKRRIDMPEGYVDFIKKYCADIIFYRIFNQTNIIF